MAFEDAIYTRNSQWSYSLKDNRIRIFPQPVASGPKKLWVEFFVDSDTPWVAAAPGTIVVGGEERSRELARGELASVWSTPPPRSFDSRCARTICAAGRLRAATIRPAGPATGSGVRASRRSTPSGPPRCLLTPANRRTRSRAWARWFAKGAGHRRRGTGAGGRVLPCLPRVRGHRREDRRLGQARPRPGQHARQGERAGSLTLTPGQRALLARAEDEPASGAAGE